MYNKEELKEIVKRIEDEMYNDLDINERMFIITRLLNNTANLIAPYMIDSEEDEKYVKAIYEILHKLLELEEEFENE